MKCDFTFRITFIAFLLFSTFSFAQSVSGTLVDKETGKTIPFATVQLGEDYGVITNQEGFFNINTKNFTENDSLIFSSMGYEQRGIALKDFEKDTVYLTRNIEQLDAVVLMKEKLTPEEIMLRVNENLDHNYNYSLAGFNVFHRSKSSSTPHQIKFLLKKAEFIKRRTLRQFNNTIDSLSQANKGKTTRYFNASLGTFVTGKHDTLLKVKMLKATKLINKRVSNNMEALSKTLLKKVGQHLKSANTFQVRTGIIPIGDSLDLSNLYAEEKEDIDSTFSKYACREISDLLKSSTFQPAGHTTLTLSGGGSTRFAHDFITEIDDYQYVLKDITSFNGELVYELTFAPDTGLFSGNGKYVGSLYISADSYAVLKVDYQLAPGSHGTKMNLKFLLGVKFVENSKSGTLIYAKNERGKYIPKYARTSGEMYAYFDRNFVLKENDERTDRMKLKFDITMETTNSYEEEWLFVDVKNISQEQFAQFKENKGVPVQEISSYNPKIWANYNILAPTEAIREYTH